MSLPSPSGSEPYQPGWGEWTVSIIGILFDIKVEMVKSSKQSLFWSSDHRVEKPVVIRPSVKISMFKSNTSRMQENPSVRHRYRQPDSVI